MKKRICSIALVVFLTVMMLCACGYREKANISVGGIGGRPGNTGTKPTVTVKPTQKPTQKPTEKATQKPTTKPTTQKATTKPVTQGATKAKYQTAENEERVRQIISSLGISGKSTTEKIRKVHDWIVCNVKYDSTHTYYHAEDALKRGTCVCQGYAELFCLFMAELGIPCEYISGTATNSSGETESHGWNAVKLSDGWYYVDCTWDDPMINGHSDYKNGSNLRYDYYLVTYNQIRKNHFEKTKVPTPAGTSTKYHDAVTKEINNNLYTTKKQQCVDVGYKTFVITDPSKLSQYVNAVNGYGAYAFVFDKTKISPKTLGDSLNNRAKTLNNAKAINGYSTKHDVDKSSSDVIWYTFQLNKYKKG